MYLEQGGVPSPGGVLGPGGYLVPGRGGGCTWSGGYLVQGGVCSSGGVPGQVLPPVDRHTPVKTYLRNFVADGKKPKT